MSTEKDLYQGELHEIPDHLKITIAECIMGYSRLEMIAIEALCLIEQADLDRRKALAKYRGSQVIDALRRWVEQIPGARTDKLWPAFKQLKEERDLIGHGIWAIREDGTPVVVWHSKFVEAEDYVGAELFPSWRFDRFRSILNNLTETVSKFRIMLEELVASLAAQEESGTDPSSEGISKPI
jgi:hypothetical protein